MEKTSFLKESVGGQSIVNKIVDNITNAIINGELNPGDKIPTEAELSESMGVGRNSVREAIKVLEAYGVVHIKRAEGTFVSQEYDSKMIYPVLLFQIRKTHCLCEGKAATFNPRQLTHHGSDSQRAANING